MAVIFDWLFAHRDPLYDLTAAVVMQAAGQTGWRQTRARGLIALALLGRGLRLALRGVLGVTLLGLFLVLCGNIFFHTERDVPHRALSPEAAVCREGADDGWDILARTSAPDGYVPNDEWAAIDQIGPDWRKKFACSIQHHLLPGYQAKDGTTKTLRYDLAFVEFQEDGKPYALREPCDAGPPPLASSPIATECHDLGYGPVHMGVTSQLGALIDHLRKGGPHYVLVFIHGWRHDASIGDENVGNIRHYAAHAARFLEERADADPQAPKPKVTAVFVGWRGARTDENWLKRHWHRIGSMIGTFSAVGTLFDRKPVSEAVAASVLAGLRGVEQELGFSKPVPAATVLPSSNPNKMIVFGHSLGGNLLATALKDDLIKKVSRHVPGTYMQPPLGNLVVLINPASEVAKWTDVQHAVWNRLAVSNAERAPVEDYIASHTFFRREQRPVVVSVTAARNWPPGGRTEADCALGGSPETLEYDWATHDLFPAFKGDFRPASVTLQRYAWTRDPNDDCDTRRAPFLRRVGLSPLMGLGALLRVLPFQNSNSDETVTIGNLDPARAPRGDVQRYYASAHPFGTTHELRGHYVPERKHMLDNVAREASVDYQEIGSPVAACPSAEGWLSAARAARERAELASHGIYWNSRDAGARAPALDFAHGFASGGIAAITRASDPFWNMRAADSAVARHDGYMLSSFICAMNQLVMDDVTNFPTPAAAASVAPDAALGTPPPTAR